MKQSNWILGLGILVAALLIAGSLYFGAKPASSSQTSVNHSEVIPTIGSIKYLSSKPLLGLIERFTSTLPIK